MWQMIRYGWDGRVRWWQPTIPRFAAFAVAAGLSFVVATPEDPPRIELTAAPAPQPLVAAVVPCDQAPAFVVIWGRYVNFPYGYSIDLPDDAVALASSPPVPQHGCSIDLGDLGQFATSTDVWRKEHPEREIWVDGSYNAAFVASLDEEVEQRIEWAREDARDLRVVARGPAKLGRLVAVRATVEYEDHATSRRVVETWVVAGRRTAWGETTDDDGRRIDDVRYTVGLVTTPARRAEDERVFDAVLRTWRLRPID